MTFKKNVFLNLVVIAVTNSSIILHGRIARECKYGNQTYEKLRSRPHFRCVYRRDNPRGMLGEHEKSFSSVRPTSQVRYHTGKPIESVVYCFYKITISKTENVSVFYEFAGTINHRFLTNQNARTILVIL